MCCGHAWRRKIEEKVRGGTRYHGGMGATIVGEGGLSVGACCGDGGGVCARAAVGASNEASERERERDGGRASDANATVYDKLKRGSWNAYKMDKIQKDIELR
jgi:hypothetical protein